MRYLILALLLLTGCAGMQSNGQPIDWSPIMSYANSMNQPTQVQQQSSNCTSQAQYNIAGTYMGTRVTCR